MGSPRHESGQWLPSCAAVAAAAAGVVALVLAPAFIVASNRESVEARWQRAAGFSPLVDYPPRDANPAALRIERLGASLGLPMGKAGRTPGAPAAKARWNALTPELKAYFAALRVPSPALAPPASGLSAFLTEPAPRLREVREPLRASEPPRWELHLERGMKYDVPDLLGHLHLQQILLVEAGESARARRFDESSEWLAPAARFQSPRRGDPR